MNIQQPSIHETRLTPTYSPDRATENTNTTPNALFVAREDGGNVVYGLNYDSKRLGIRQNAKVMLEHHGRDLCNQLFGV